MLERGQCCDRPQAARAKCSYLQKTLYQDQDQNAALNSASTRNMWDKSRVNHMLLILQLY